LNLASTGYGPPHLPVGATATNAALFAAKDCVEPASYRAAYFSSAQSINWKVAMQHEYEFFMASDKWELVDLPEVREGRRVGS
jgi:hypothetical protein